MAELKPCPFCKYDDDLRVLENLNGLYCIRCMNCHAKGPQELTRQQAIDAWNKRS